MAERPSDIYDQVAALMTLQELDLVVKETAIVHGNGDHQSVDVVAKIAGIERSLDPDLLARYRRLSKIGPAVVRVVSGNCLGCNLAIPLGDLKRIENKKMAPECPNCGRFLKL